MKPLTGRSSNTYFGSHELPNGSASLGMDGDSPIISRHVVPDTP